MSGLGNFLVGAGQGAAFAAADLANKYIDEEIQQRRAEAMAELQHRTMVRGEEYMQSAPVQERRLANERNVTRMRNEEALGAEVERTTNPELRQAKIDDRVQFLKGTTQAEIDAKNAITEGTAGVELDKERMRAKVLTPLEIERARGIADAHWSAQAQYDERLKGKTGAANGKKMSEDAKIELQDINRQDEALQKAINDGVLGGTLKQDPNDPAWQHAMRQKQALEVKRLRVKAREGVISGADDAASLIASGATPAELQASLKQAQLIGSDYARDFAAAIRGPEQAPSKAGAISRDVAATGVKDYIVDINGRRQAYGNAKLPEAQGGGAAAAASSPNLVEQRRAGRQAAPEGSPQAKWEARQAEARAAASAKDSERQARLERERAAFDADARSMDPLELVRKYSDPGSRASLDTQRLARLNQIERSIR